MARLPGVRFLTGIAFLFPVVAVLDANSAAAADKEFVYAQKTGKLTLDGKEIGTGYSGHGDGKNNPNKEKEKDVGPIPAGLWQIGPAFTHETKGPVVMRLTPIDAKTHGRDGFLIHGDNKKMDGSASNGCIVLGPDVRKKIAESGVTKLRVVRE
jgi:hypothetical protein